MEQEKSAATGFENTIGMRFLPIPPGSFVMGQPDGDPDERPAHAVRIARPFAISETPVTNSQYERFDPGHRTLRGIRNLSSGDNEAVTHVSYEDA
nr:SUMF1/EgtB/PvdO family nonheme iron enzyme [Clostridia bacterium]